MSQAEQLERPKAAMPFLASELVPGYQYRPEGQAPGIQIRSDGERKRKRAKVGYEDIDGYVLDGGLERGCVVGVSCGEEGMGVGRVIALNTLASTILPPQQSELNESHIADQSALGPDDNKPPAPRALLVSTTSSSPLPLLVSILRTRIRDYLDNTKYRNQHGHERDQEEQRILKDALERVDFARVFDIEGLWEAVGEVGMEGEADEEHAPDHQSEEVGNANKAVDAEPEKISHDTRAVDALGQAGVGAEDDDYSSDLSSPPSSLPSRSSPPAHSSQAQVAEPKFRTQVPDSEEDTDSESDIPILPSARIAQEAVTVTASSPPQPHNQEPAAEDNQQQKPTISPKPQGTTNPAPSAPETDPTTTKQPGPLRGPTQIIIIDPFTPLITSLFSRRETSEAHSTLATLTHALHSLAARKNLLVLLLNTCNTAPPVPALSENPEDLQASYAPANRGYENVGYGNGNAGYDRKGKGKRVSIFGACMLRPSLGKLWEKIVHVSVLCHRLPRGRRDAEVLYTVKGAEGGGEGGDARVRDSRRVNDLGVEKGDVEYAWVFEVLLDESPGGQEEKRKRRDQRWSPFVVALDGDGVGRIVDPFVGRG